MAASLASTSFSRTRVRRDRPADPEARRERLGERAEVDHGLGVVGVQRGQRVAVEPEQAVGVVLEHQDAVPPGDLDDARPALGRQRDAGGVVVVGHRVEELDAAALRPQARSASSSASGTRPVVVQRHVDDVGLVGAEDAERADVAGRLGEHDVPGVDEDPGHEVERLLRPGGDDDVVGVRLRPAAGAITSMILSRRPGSPWPGAVLQRHGAALRHEPGQRLGDDVERKGREVRHAAGQRDHLGPAGDGEQGADLGGGHARGSGRRRRRPSGRGASRPAGRELARPPGVAASSLAAAPRTFVVASFQLFVVR